MNCTPVEVDCGGEPVSLHALVGLRIIYTSGLSSMTNCTLVEVDCGGEPVSLHALVRLRIISRSGLEKWTESGQVL